MDTENETPLEVVRRHLLTAVLDGRPAVERIEIKEVTLTARQPTGLHLHRCSVVGYVTEGAIVFQLEGQPARDLKPGDAFYEPANVRVSRFDNATDGPAKFIAFYLLDADDQELITMLPDAALDAE